MGDKNWKKWERTVARIFGGERRGASTSDPYGSGKNDAVPGDEGWKGHSEGWSIECKCRAAMGYSEILKACREAEQAKGDTDIPVAVVKRPGDEWRNGIVAMRLETFQEFFIG